MDLLVGSVRLLAFAAAGLLLGMVIPARHAGLVGFAGWAILLTVWLTLYVDFFRAIFFTEEATREATFGENALMSVGSSLVATWVWSTFLHARTDKRNALPAHGGAA